MTIDEAVEAIGDVLSEREWGEAVDFSAEVRTILETLVRDSIAKHLATYQEALHRPKP